MARASGRMGLLSVIALVHPQKERGEDRENNRKKNSEDRMNRRDPNEGRDGKKETAETKAQQPSSSCPSVAACTILGVSREKEKQRHEERDSPDERMARKKIGAQQVL